LRLVYRSKDNRDYWEDRWKSAGPDSGSFENLDIYPIKYAELIMPGSQRILEAGCGSGRLYFHYKNQGKDIYGLDFSQHAIENIRRIDPNANVRTGDICELPYADASFDAVLAFGLYHNLELEEQRKAAFSETSRVLKPGGRLAASVRFDSLENSIIERIVRKRSEDKDFTQFHRAHFSLEDLRDYLKEVNMEIDRHFYTRNVSFLFKYDIFRKAEMKSGIFIEKEARSKGFQLNDVGAILDNLLHVCFPALFSNLLVIVAHKLP